MRGHYVPLVDATASHSGAARVEIRRVFDPGRSQGSVSLERANSAFRDCQTIA